MLNRKRKPRSDKDEVKLTARHLKFFRYAGDQHGISTDLSKLLLPRLDGMEWLDDGYTIRVDPEKFLLAEPGGRKKIEVTDARISQINARLAQGGYTNLRYPLAFRPGVTNVKKAGLAEIGRTYSPTDMSSRDYNHTWACNFYRMWMEMNLVRRGHLEFEIKTDRVYRSDPTYLLKVYPDFTVRFGDTFIAVEIELTEKTALERYESKKHAARALGCTSHAYLCPPWEFTNIKKHFVGEPNYQFLYLDKIVHEDGTETKRVLENGMEYKFMGPV